MEVEIQLPSEFYKMEKCCAESQQGNKKVKAMRNTLVVKPEFSVTYGKPK